MICSTNSAARSSSPRCFPAVDISVFISTLAGSLGPIITHLVSLYKMRSKDRTSQTTSPFSMTEDTEILSYLDRAKAPGSFERSLQTYSPFIFVTLFVFILNTAFKVLA